MSKLLKIVVMGFTIASLCTPAWAVLDLSSDPIDVTATVPPLGSTTLTVTPQGGAIAFDVSTATLAAPWVRSAGYIQVQYSSTRNAPYVGVRIVSKNVEIVADADTDGDRDTDDLVACVVPTLVDADNDGAIDENSYSGLIFASDLDAGTAGEDPSRRAVLAWQVFNEPPAAITVPSVTISPDPGRGGSVIYDNDDPADSASVGLWNTAWDYVADVNNDGFLNTVWDSATSGPAYTIVASGFSGSDNGYLAQHPRLNAAHDPRVADGDICIYLAARFANTNWGSTPTAAPRARLLPGGDYQTRLYVEMIYDE